MKGKNRITGAIGIVIRTHDEPKNPYTPLLLRTILGPDYYDVFPQGESPARATLSSNVNLV